MNMSSPAVIAKLLEENVNIFYAGRYLSAASVTFLLYDYSLTLREEVRLVWSRPLGFMQVLFLFSRYFALANVLLVAHIASGMATYSTKFCKGWVIEAAISFLLSVATGHFILIMRLYALYDQKKNILRILQITFVFTYAIAFAFGVLTVTELESNILWLPLIAHECILTTRPRFLVGFWAPQVVFELFMFVLTVVNAAERPRRAQSKLMAVLNRDGFIYFFVVFGIRFVNLVLSTLPNPNYDLMITYFTWAVTITTLSRMILKVESMREEASRSPGYLTGTFELEEHEDRPSVSKVAINTVTTTQVR